MKKISAILILFTIPIITFSQILKKTQVLILGTPHLAQVDNFQSSYLKPVLDKLKVEEFNVVAVEHMSAELLFDVKSRKKEYWQNFYNSFDQFIEFGLSHQKRLSINFEIAQNKLSELKLKSGLSENDRLDYVNSYICTYDIWSAILHYKQLRDKSPLSEVVINLLDDLSASKNEINTIAIEIAKTNKLNQIHYIDDLQDETILLNEFPKFIIEYQDNASSINKLLNRSGFYQKIDSIQSRSIQNENLYPLYKFYNSNKYMANDFDAQWALWFKTDFKSQTDRSRYSLWEMRNLIITANILRVIASKPKSRVLVIIGAAHKSFIEKYLRQIKDIKLLEF